MGKLGICRASQMMSKCEEGCLVLRCSSSKGHSQGTLLDLPNMAVLWSGAAVTCRYLLWAPGL